MNNEKKFAMYITTITIVIIGFVAWLALMVYNGETAREKCDNACAEMDMICIKTKTTIDDRLFCTCVEGEYIDIPQDDDEDR